MMVIQALRQLTDRLRDHPGVVVFAPQPGWEPDEEIQRAHTCPDCRHIVVRTDGHHCPEEER